MGPDIVASLPENKKDDDRQHAWRYADIYAAISPNWKALLPSIGTTRTSAYSWLCRRRHNHDLRHTFGTRMIAKADIRRAQEWMGHADVHSTMRYLHYVPRADDAALVAAVPGISDLLLVLDDQP